MGDDWELLNGKCTIKNKTLMTYENALKFCRSNDLEIENKACFNCSTLVNPICSKGFVNDTSIRNFFILSLEKMKVESSIIKVQAGHGKFIRIKVIQFVTQYNDDSIALKIMDETPEQMIAHMIYRNCKNSTILSLSDSITIRTNFYARASSREFDILARSYVTYEEVSCGLGENCPGSSNCGTIGEISGFKLYKIYYKRPKNKWNEYKYCLWRFKVEKGSYIKVRPISINMKSSKQECRQYTDIYDGPYIKTVRRKMRVCENEMSIFVSSSNSLTIAMMLEVITQKKLRICINDIIC